MDLSTSMADAPFYSPEHGEFLSSNASRLQEILQDYNPYIELVFIPTARRDGLSAPFALRDTSPWHAPYIIRHMSAEEVERPGEILAWLFKSDLSKHSALDILTRERLEREAETLVNRKRDHDIAQERQELVAALVVGGRDQKHAYRHGGKIFTDRGVRDASTSVY
tara:strand:+ start:21712 stop:22209 length:498 start_codon:yes stop_codon:yes gene_type:complete